jgi:TolB-like protein/Tfp pilus assembly protein PilF
LFVTRGGPTKITDFGIALRPADGRAAAGGTPQYASPEQSRGGEVDGRSDIFSLGAVLYEMISGHRMFQPGGEPPPLALPRGTPTDLEHIIARCVEPNPAARFQTAEDLHAALDGWKTRANRGPKQWLWTVAAVALLLAIALALIGWWNGGWLRPNRVTIRSIAVLPLLNLSGEAAQEHLADGMTEALTSDLAELGAFRVTSRTSAMSYKGTREPIANIAARLKVDALIEGSVSRAGNRVRVVAQLIDGARDVHLWSRTYERDFGDLHLLQSELAQAIAAEVEASVTPERRGRLNAKRPVNPEAYEAYLKGMFHLNKFTPEGFEQGMSYLRQAVAKDPSDPMAHAKLALGYALMGHDRSPEMFAHAKAAALMSLDLGRPMAEAYAVLGMVDLYCEWNFDRGAQNLRRALDLNPSLAEARRDYAWYLELVGRGQEGLAEMKRAIDLEPLVPIFSADLAWQHLDHGNFDQALSEAEKALELDPKFAQALAIAGWVYQEKGMDDQAVAAHRKAAADPAWRWPLARTYAMLGRRAEALEIAAGLIGKPGPMDQWGLAAVYAALGDKDEAFRWLQRAYTSRFSFMPWNHVPNLPTYGSKSDLFGPLRSDVRFQVLGRRIGVGNPGSI